MKYLIYARISPRGSDFEGETSIPMQVDMCRQFIERGGDEVVEVVEDEFYSGKDFNRPGIQKVLHELRTGAKWEAIAFYKMSRLSRSQRDSINFLAELSERGKGFLSVTERIDYSTPVGRAMLGIMQVINQLEREQTAENTRNRMISIAAKGECPYGRAPYGYVRGEAGDNVLKVDERAALVVRDIFEMYANPAHSINDILRKYPRFRSKQGIRNLIDNRTYLGLICYAGKEYQGKHPAIVSAGLWERAAAMRREQGGGATGKPEFSCRPKAQKYPYILAGLLRCKCGRFMTPASAKSGKYHYYQCTDSTGCKHRIAAHKVEQAAMERLLRIEDPKMDNALLEALEIERREYVESVKPELAQARAALAAIKLEQNRLINVLASGDVDAANLRMINDRLKQSQVEERTAQAKIEDLSSVVESGVDVFKAVQERLQHIKRMRDAFTRCADDPAAQRQAALLYIDKIAEQADGSFRFYLTEEASSPITKKWLPGLDLNELIPLEFFPVLPAVSKSA